MNAVSYDWAATHRPSGSGTVRHRPGTSDSVAFRATTRAATEEAEHRLLAPGATRAVGAGTRAVEEAADEWRTCFERDRDRIEHSAAFRRLAGKTQVHVHPDDHQRTRLTHAIEVAQVAVAIARPLGLNVTLAEAIALGHDCGHGPGGHASEEAFSPYVPGGFHHAVWGADVTLAPLNLTVEVLDGIRNHSWSRPVPGTPEAVVVSWADRIAYVCHDLEDAVSVGIVTHDDLPDELAVLSGAKRADHLRFFIASMVEGSLGSGTVGMTDVGAEALAAFRAFNYKRIYARPASVAQGRLVVEVLRALVEFFAEKPTLIPGRLGGSPEWEAVRWVGGMTDRFAFGEAIRRLGWRADRLPVEVGVGSGEWREVPT